MNDKKKVLYVPLDDRDCNYTFPYLLSRMTDDMELLRPDFSWMGELKKPSDRKKIWEWLFENVKDCDYGVLSVDTLVYGNIVNSRTHHLSRKECEEGIENFRRLKTLNPDFHIHALTWLQELQPMTAVRRIRTTGRITDARSGSTPGFWTRTAREKQVRRSRLRFPFSGSRFRRNI